MAMLSALSNGVVKWCCRSVVKRRCQIPLSNSVVKWSCQIAVKQGLRDKLLCSYTQVEPFNFESTYQILTKSIENCSSYAHFSLLRWQAGQHAKIFTNQIHMLSPSIQRKHTKFTPNQLKNAKVMNFFHFKAGRLVGWQAGLAGQHAKIFTIQILILSPSIQRLHTKFQLNRLKNAKVMQVFHFQAGKLVGWQASLVGQHAQIHINHIHMLSSSIQRLHTKFQPKVVEKRKRCAHFSLLG